MKTMDKKIRNNNAKLIASYVCILGLSLAVIIPYACHQLKSNVSIIDIVVWVCSLILVETGLRKKNGLVLLIAILQFVIVMLHMMIL